MTDEPEQEPRDDGESLNHETDGNDEMDEDEPASPMKEEETADVESREELDQEQDSSSPAKEGDEAEPDSKTEEPSSDGNKEDQTVGEESNSDYRLDDIEMESKRSADYMPAKVKTLGEFLKSMSDFAPIIPDAVSDYYLAKAGFNTSDTRLKRLLALATQKFISDVASDAYQYSRIRSSASSSNAAAQARARATGVNIPGVASSSGGSNRPVLTMDDLSSALAEYGLNIKRPDFYR